MISCKEYVAIKKAELKEKIAAEERKPTLLIFKFDDPSSDSYTKGIEKDCKAVGIDCMVTHLPNNITKESLEYKIVDANCDDEIDGIIIQAPLPKHINPDNHRHSIFVEKDVDGRNPYSPFEPCTPLGVINYLKYNNYKFEGKDICVVGRSEHVGKPLARMLTDLDATVTLCHSKSDRKSVHYNIIGSDMVITCIDKIEYFDKEFKHYIGDVIDIGLGVNSEGKLRGNLSQYAVEDVTDCINRFNAKKPGRDHFIISGVGGVGLLTRLELLNNTYKAFCIQRKGE